MHGISLSNMGMRVKRYGVGEHFPNFPDAVLMKAGPKAQAGEFIRGVTPETFPGEPPENGHGAAVLGSRNGGRYYT